MNSETLHIDQLLQATYAGFEPAMPAFAWEGIEAKLDAKKNRKVFGWWKAAVVVAILSGVATIFFNNQAETGSNAVRQNQETQSTAGQAKEKTSSDNDNAASNGATDEAKANQTQSGQKDLGSFKHESNKANHMPWTPNTKQAEKNNQQNPDKTDNSNAQDVESNTETYEILGKNLIAFGPRKVSIDGGVDDVNLEQNDPKNVVYDADPYKKIGGSKFIVGLGLGQIVNAAGVSVNPEYKNYVHEDYLKRMREGEGLLSAMSFSGTIGYEIADNNYLYTGVSFFQRRNSLNFNFSYFAPVTSNANGEKADKNGNYPIYDYLRFNPLQVQYKGTNIFTEFDLPFGWMGQYQINKKYTFIPSVSASMGFISISDKNATLDYAAMDLVSVNKNWYKKGFALMGASAGIYRDFGSNLKWGINASGNYTLTQMYVSGSTVRPRAFTGGLSAQILWRLD